MLFGSAFKGANGVDQPFSDIQRYLMNQKSYIKLYEEKKAVGPVFIIYKNRTMIITKRAAHLRMRLQLLSPRVLEN